MEETIIKMKNIFDPVEIPHNINNSIGSIDNKIIHNFFENKVKYKQREKPIESAIAISFSSPSSPPNLPEKSNKISLSKYITINTNKNPSNPNNVTNNTFLKDIL